MIIITCTNKYVHKRDKKRPYIDSSGYWSMLKLMVEMEWLPWKLFAHNSLHCHCHYLCITIGRFQVISIMMELFWNVEHTNIAHTYGWMTVRQSGHSDTFLYRSSMTGTIGLFFFPQTKSIKYASSRLFVICWAYKMWTFFYLRVRLLLTWKLTPNDI